MSNFNYKDARFDRLRSMSRDELENELESLRSEAGQIVERADSAMLSERDSDRFDEIDLDVRYIRERMAKEARMRELVDADDGCVQYGDGDHKTAEQRMVAASSPIHTARDSALRTVERSLKAKRIDEDAAGVVEKLVGGGESLSARWAVATGDEAYRSGFIKVLQDPTRGHMLWTPQEQRAFQAASMVQRAMAEGTDNLGGYLVPLDLDPAVMLTSGGSLNPLRQIARVVKTNSNVWAGITSAGVTAEWTDEAEEMADASPTLGNPEIPVHKGDAFVPFSYELEQDGVGFMEQLRALLLDGAEQLTATAYTLGSGVGQPKGIVTALSGVGGSIVTSSTETIAGVDFYSTQNALPPRFQSRAVWMTSLPVMNLLRQEQSGAGALNHPGLQLNPPSLLGRRVYENSLMDSTLNVSVSESNYVAIYGDFKSGFVIADRIGTTLEIIPNLFGANRRPTGQRGAVMWFRTGSDVVVPNAFRMLNYQTS